MVTVITGFFLMSILGGRSRTIARRTLSKPIYYRRTEVVDSPEGIGPIEGPCNACVTTFESVVPSTLESRTELKDCLFNCPRGSTLSEEDDPIPLCAQSCSDQYYTWENDKENVSNRTALADCLRDGCSSKPWWRTYPNAPPAVIAIIAFLLGA